MMAAKMAPAGVVHESELFFVTGYTTDTKLFRLDAMEIEGDVWLVPEWIVAKDGTRLRPKIVVRPPQGTLTRVAGTSADPVRYTTAVPIATSAFLGTEYAPEGYDVHLEPQIHIDTRRS